jgi:diguanylate cyclase (GGDEF)-like protein
MDPALIEKLENCQTLPSLPIVAMQVIEHAKKDDSDSALIAGILEKDPALASKIVALANSAANFPRSPIVTVKDAITRMGLDMTMTLALSFSFAKAMHDCDMNSMDHEVFWRRCLVSGVVARVIAKYQGLDKPERFFLAGLIQDIGMLVINEIESDRYGVVYHSAQNHDELHRFEKGEFRTTHTDVGAWLLKFWGMPNFYVDLIKNSHSECTSKSSPELKSVVFAGKYAELWVLEDTPEQMGNLLDQGDKCKLFSSNEITEIIEQVTAQLPSINNVFETNIQTDFSAADLIEEAKHLLVERNLKLMQQLAQAQTEVAEVRASEKQLKDQLKKDQLTGIYNRTYIESISEKAFLRADKTKTPLTIMFLDIDHFKQVNDKYGHQSGDLALKQFARALIKFSGKNCYVGRYGGEEFVVVMPGISSDIAITIANRIRLGLKKTPLKVADNIRITLSSSVGIATHLPSQGKSFASAERLLDAADKTMYQAKRTGRDKAMIYSGS